MTQFVEQLRNQAKWYAQPGHNARDLMDSHLLEKAADEIECLRTKIEAMEQQEPVGKFIQHPSNGMWEQDGYGDNPDARPLYALPGAQGEGK